MKIRLNFGHSKVLDYDFEIRLSHKSLLFDVTLYIESLQIIWNLGGKEITHKN